jgi:septal ring factor EnvC (AmiA/AmiB activator)
VPAEMTKDANFSQIMSSDAERSKLNQSLRALEKETSKLEDDIKKAMQLINENDNLKKEVETDKNVHERL